MTVTLSRTHRLLLLLLMAAIGWFLVWAGRRDDSSRNPLGPSGESVGVAPTVRTSVRSRPGSPEADKPPPDIAPDRNQKSGNRLTVTVVRCDASESVCPVEGAEVYLLPTGVEGVEELDGAHFRAFTDSKGAAVLRGVPAGGHSLGVKASGLLPAIQWVEVPADLGDLAIRVVLAEGARISGSILDAVTGLPVRNARVLYESLGGQPGVRDWDYPGIGGRDRIWDLCNSDPLSGEFSVSGLPVAGFRLTAKAVGYADLRMETHAPQEGLALRLQPSGVVVLSVRDWKPDPNGIIRMTLRRRFTGEVAGSLSVRGGDGELRLGDGLSEGDYRIEVEGEGRGYFESELTIRSPGEIVRVEAELGDPAWIRVPRDSPADGTGFLCFLDGNDDILAIRLVEPADPRVMVKPGHHRFRFLDPGTLTPPMDGDAVRGETLTVVLPAVPPTVVAFEGGAAGSWTVLDEEGKRRTLYLFRGLNLVHIGDEVDAREGDRLLTDPLPGLRLVSLAAPERQHPLLPGRATRFPGER